MSGAAISRVAGGKGANLGELTRAGLPVPPGFVLTTDAYRAYVATTGIGDEILAALADTERRTIRRPASAPCSPPRSRTRSPANCCAARKELGPSVAVRSSATAEDLDDASFAGQQDTFLDVRGDDALLAAVRALLGLAVDGAGHRLPGPSRDRPGRDRPRGRRAGDGRRRRGGRHVHRERHHGRARRGGDRRRVGARRGGGRRRGDHGRPRGREGDGPGAVARHRGEGGA